MVFLPVPLTILVLILLPLVSSTVCLQCSSILGAPDHACLSGVTPGRVCKGENYDGCSTVYEVDTKIVTRGCCYSSSVTPCT